jgi:flavin reductase (DIM6/NTAB) family NADH-FMN oxidoreductase RutF
MTVDAQRFRTLFGSYPSSVAIVTTLDLSGEPKGFTCNSVCAVSLDPPLLSICVDRKSSTLASIYDTGVFVVNLLAEGGEKASRTFAGSAPAKFDTVQWRKSAMRGGLPVLHDIALAYAECVVTQQIRAGDHDIIVARVEHCHTFAKSPLLYFQRSYLSWTPTYTNAGGPR